MDSLWRVNKNPIISACDFLLLDAHAVLVVLHYDWATALNTGQLLVGWSHDCTVIGWLDTRWHSDWLAGHTMAQWLVSWSYDCIVIGWLVTRWHSDWLSDFTCQMMFSWADLMLLSKLLTETEDWSLNQKIFIISHLHFPLCEGESTQTKNIYTLQIITQVWSPSQVPYIPICQIMTQSEGGTITWLDPRHPYIPGNNTEWGRYNHLTKFPPSLKDSYHVCWVLCITPHAQPSVPLMNPYAEVYHHHYKGVKRLFTMRP